MSKKEDIMTWDPALFQIIAIFAVSLAAFILVSIMAWPANKMLFRALVGWFRSLPDRRRAKRDPEFRRRQERIAKYDAFVFALVVATAMRNKAEKALAENPNQDPRELRHKNRDYRDALDDFSEVKTLVAKYLAELTDEDIGAVAEWLSQASYESLVPAEEIAAFLRDERTLAKEHPVMVVGHLERQIKRLGPFYEQRKSRPG
jgi:hypothetical protein